MHQFEQSSPGYASLGLHIGLHPKPKGDTSLPKKGCITSRGVTHTRGIINNTQEVEAVTKVTAF